MELYSAVKLNIFIWRCFGLWPPEDTTSWQYVAYQLYFTFLFICLHIVYNATMLAKALFYSEDLAETTESLFILVTALGSFPKIFSIIRNRKLIRQLLLKLQEESFNPLDEEKQILNTKIVRLGMLFRLIFFTSSVAACIIMLMVPIIDYHNGVKKFVLPMKAWYPFRTDRVPVYYFIYAYQLSMLIQCFEVISIDSFFTTMMAIASGQLEMLAHSLKNAGRRPDKLPAAGPITKTVARRNKFDEDLIHCMEHHSAIAKFVSDLQSIFSVPITVQFITSGLIICLTGFQLTLLSLSKNPISYIAAVIYQLAMLSQIFCPCWFGNEIIHKSAALGTALYSSSWPEELFDRKENQAGHAGALRPMRIIMERMKRPLQVTAGGLLIINMPTFMSILQSAYSYYAVLQRLNSS